MKVKQLIKKLQKLNPNLPIYIRPKYSGIITWEDEVAVKERGISEMEKKGKVNRVVILI